MIQLVPGSTNTFSYKAVADGVVVQPATIAIALKNGSTTITIAAAPTWDPVTQRTNLVIAPAEISDSLVWAEPVFEVTWTYDGATLKDKEGAVVVERPVTLPVSLAKVRNKLRANADTAPNAELWELVEEANSEVQRFLGRQLIAREVTEQIRVGRNQLFIALRHWPLLSSVVTLTPPDGVAAPTIVTYATTGMLEILDIFIIGGSRVPFSQGTWTVTYTGGLSADPEWESIKTDLTAAVSDLVVDWWTNRNARAESERDGDWSVTTLDENPRVARKLLRLKARR